MTPAQTSERLTSRLAGSHFSPGILPQALVDHYCSIVKLTCAGHEVYSLIKRCILGERKPQTVRASVDFG